MNKMKMEYVPVDRIEVNWDFRIEPRDIETEKGIKKSLEEIGMAQPIKVRPKGKKYEVVAGRGRLKILKEAGEKKIPVVIEELSDEHAKLQSIVENIQRQNLTPMELAKAFQELLSSVPELKKRKGDRYTGYKWLVDKTGFSKVRITQIMSLVEAPEPIRKKIEKAVKKKRISEDVAVEILSSTRTKPKIRERALQRAIEMGVNKEKIGGRTARKIVKEEKDREEFEKTHKALKSAGLIDEDGYRKKTPDDFVVELVGKIAEFYWWLEPKVVKHLSKDNIKELHSELTEFKKDKLEPFLEELEMNML